MNRAFSRKEILLLHILAVALFAGRAWQGIFWDLPLRTFFWDEHLLSGVVEYLYGGPWHDYVRDLRVDQFFNNLGFGIGVYWACCALAAAYLSPKRAWLRFPIYFGTFLLFLLSLLFWKNKFFNVGQLFEYAMQLGTPLLLVYARLGGQNNERFRFSLRLIIATSFVCHGLYAAGYYPVPGRWVQWCLDMFYLPNDSAAYTLLWVMGILDFVAAALLFIRPVAHIGILYCIAWGTMTALARVVANFYVEFPLLSLHQWTYQTVLRFAHGGLPLLLWWVQYNLKPNPKVSSKTSIAS